MSLHHRLNTSKRKCKSNFRKNIHLYHIHHTSFLHTASCFFSHTEFSAAWWIPQGWNALRLSKIFSVYETSYIICNSFTHLWPIMQSVASTHNSFLFTYCTHTSNTPHTTHYNHSLYLLLYLFALTLIQTLSMEDENLLDDELAGPTTNVDSPATFSKKLILKFRICHGSTGTDAVTHNNNIT